MQISKNKIYGVLGFIFIIFAILAAFLYYGLADNNRLSRYLNDDYISLTSAKKIIQLQSWQTSNGAKINFATNKKSQIVDLEITFDAGSTRDADKPGLSELVFISLEQNNKHNQEKTFEELDEIGVTVNIAHERDKVKITLRTLNVFTYLAKAVNLVAKLIAEPEFDVELLTQSKQQLQTKLKQLTGAPEDLANSLLYRNLYANHPYSYQDLTSINTINSIDLVDVNKFHKQFYAAKNATLAIVGDLNINDVKELAEMFFAYFPVGTEAIRLPKVVATINNQSINKKIDGLAQAHIMIGALGVSKHSPEFFPFLVANHILGGSSIDSRLNNIIRAEHSYAYSINTDYQTMIEPGPFWINVISQQKNANMVVKDIINVLQEFIETGPTAEEVKTAKRNLIGSFPLCLTNSHDILQVISEMAYYNVSPEFLYNYQHAIQAVSKEQIQETFRNIIDLNNLLTIVIR